MNQFLSIAKKELRALFVSPVAMVFVAIFLVMILFTFFWAEAFFQRNTADVRPLFAWLPLVLIALASPLSMRLWSEEQRSGTIELLLTMPVPVHRLALGKFVAALALVAISLVLTTGLPITVSLLGKLDWGPVIGGYLAALLVAATYLSLGLCVSAATSNGLISLLMTLASCSFLYAIGSRSVVSFASGGWADLLRALGTSSRFESIQRGVIDLRDLIYYFSLSVGFVVLSIVLVEKKRWSQGAETRPRRRAMMASVALLGGNLLLLNLNISGVTSARIDLTASGEYSTSGATKKVLASLEAPLLIRGYVSKKTHQLLAPLAPKIRDLLAEYDRVGGKNVRSEFLDPREDPAIEKEANEAYGINSLAFNFAERHRAGIVNSYFHILIKYGDRHHVLRFQDIIELRPGSHGSVEVRLRNFEYDLTSAIRKLVVSFTPVEDIFARAEEKVELVAYITPKTLPKNLEKTPGMIAAVANDLTKRSGGRFDFRQINPQGKKNKALREQLFQAYGFRPMAASLLSRDYFYLHLVAKTGDRVERIYLAPDMKEAQIKTEIAAALKRLVPGFLKTVGIVAEKTMPRIDPAMIRMGRKLPPPIDHVRLLKSKLGETYQTEDMSLESGRVPGHIDALVIVGPHENKLSDKARFAIDQYLMRGGSIIAMVGAYMIDLPGMRQAGKLQIKKVFSPLHGLLSSWGITVEKTLCLDSQNRPFPVPVEREVMGYRVREMKMLDYPYWVDVRPDGMDEGSPVSAGLPSVILQWASPLKVAQREEVSSTVLLRSSQYSWTDEKDDIQPDFRRFPDGGFGHPQDADLRSRPLAVLSRGMFTSAFAGKKSPLFEDASEGKRSNKHSKDSDEKEAKKRRTSRTLESSPPGARLAVVGSSDMVHDAVLGLLRQSGGESFMNNLNLVQNLVDWGVSDTDLLAIRGRSTFARTLRPMKRGEANRWELLNVMIMILSLGALLAVAIFWRRGLRPLALPSTKATRAKKEGE